MVKKSVLLVGSSFSAAPLFFLLKKRGLHVSVCGRDKADPCHRYADASFFIDYSDRDELFCLVERERFDYIVPTCNDYSYMSCAWVAQQLGYPGFDSLETAEIIHTKNRFRTVTGEHDLPAPKSRRHRNGAPIETGSLQFPLLVKPVDSFSGRGVTKVATEEELSVAVEHAMQTTRSSEVVIEEFVDGVLHSHSAFIRDGKVVIDFFVDEYCTVYPYQVNCSNHPSFLSATIQNEVRQSIHQLASLLKLEDGLLHTQFISNCSKFWVIECMRRCPGDLYGNLIERSTGIAYMDLYVRPFLREAVDAEAGFSQLKPFGRHTISVDKSLVNYAFSQQIPAINVQIVPLKTSGEKLEVAPFDKLAILFAEYDSKATMLDVTPRLADYIKIQSLEDTYLER